MTLQSIKNALATKYFKVGNEVFVRNLEPGVKLYGIPIIEKDGDAMWENTIQVCQNGDIDEWYWKNGEPKAGAYAFQDEIKAYIKAKVADGTIEGVRVLNYDFVNNRVFATVIKNNAGTLNETNVWIDKDGVGNLRYRIVI